MYLVSLPLPPPPPPPPSPSNLKRCGKCVTDSFSFSVVESIPHSWIVYNKYVVPLPSASPRDVCLQRMWMPSYLTRNGTSGIWQFFFCILALICIHIWLIDLLEWVKTLENCHGAGNIFTQPVMWRP